MAPEEYTAGRRKAESLMKKAGVAYRFKKKFRVTTDSNHSYPIAPNLLNREFNVSSFNRVWGSDITYLWTKDGCILLWLLTCSQGKSLAGHLRII